MARALPGFQTFGSSHSGPVTPVSMLCKLAMALLVLVQALVCWATELQYPVGGFSDAVWEPPLNPDQSPDLNFYQDWADQVLLRVNDSIYFQFDTDLYDLTVLWSEQDFVSCTVQNKAIYTKRSTLFFASSGTFYITSSGGLDNTVSSNCQDGMRFKIQVYDLDPVLPPTEYNVQPPGLETPAPAPAPVPQNNSLRAASPQLSTEGVDIRFGITWEPQTDPNFYTNFLAESLRKNGFTFLPDTAVLVFSYDKHKHKVLQVTKADFESCTIPAVPIAIFANPDAAVPLTGDSNYYFIDGVGTSCATGNMKMAVHVGPALSSDATTQRKKKRFPWEAVVVPCFCALGVLLSLWGMRLWYLRRNGTKPRGKYDEQHVVVSGVYAPKFGKTGRQQSAIICGMFAGNLKGARIVFSFKELKRATDNFSEDNQVGTGGFGTVYRGTLDDGSVVAIKRAKHAGTSDTDQFINEVSILLQVNNRNLVKLLGCCVELEVPLLVYEFIPNGTLQEHLTVAQASTKLDWATRLKIAIQTAEALKYLHVQASPPIFHRDVKSANILLDDGFNAKVADFGLSKLVDLEATHVSTVVKGTPGYLDPEYFHNFQITDKTDVYSYGVVLLELITSKKPIDVTLPDADQNLALRCVRLIKSGKSKEIIDPLMLSKLSETDLQAVQAVAQVAVACLVPSRSARPSMSEVVEMLQRIKGPGSEPKAEEFYNKDDAGQRAAFTALQMQALADLSEDFTYTRSQSTASQTPSSTSTSYDSNTTMDPR